MHAHIICAQNLHLKYDIVEAECLALHSAGSESDLEECTRTGTTGMAVKRSTGVFYGNFIQKLPSISTRTCGTGKQDLITFTM